MQNQVGFTIRKKRKSNGLAQGELASSVGMTQTWLSLVERGQFVPSPEMVKEIHRNIFRLVKLKSDIADAQAKAAAEIIANYNS
jgi:transcriptional regulator with XRE-family HTH domain